MGWFAVLLRRSLWVSLIAVAGTAGYSWWRQRLAVESSGPPEWPPLIAATPSTLAATPTVTPSSVASSSASPTTTTSSATVASSGTSTATSSVTSSVVNALVDAPDARSRDGAVGKWTAAGDDGSCPITHPVKANDNSGIFHVPGGRFYDRTRAERCYETASDALTDGYRQAKN